MMNLQIPDFFVFFVGFFLFLLTILEKHQNCIMTTANAR